MLEPTELRLYRSESDIVRFAQGEGYIQVGDNKALVLVEDAIEPERRSTSPSCATSSRTATAEARGRRAGTEAQRRACATSAAGRRSSRSPAATSASAEAARPQRRGVSP